MPTDFELDDFDDESVVDLTGPCNLDGSPVNADGVCGHGHDDLDRADAAETFTSKVTP